MDRTKDSGDPVTFDEWLRIGLDAGFCGPTICWLHDGIPTSAYEDGMIDAGDDPCIHLIRLYQDAEHAAAITENHSPSTWRKPQ